MTIPELKAKLEAAKCPEDVFGKHADEMEVKDTFRMLAKLTHPDRNGNAVEASLAFVKLQFWKDRAEQKFEDGTYGKTTINPVEIQTARFKYTLTDKLSHDGGFADLYQANSEPGGKAVLVKIVCNPGNNDMMERERTTLKAIHAKHITTENEKLLVLIPGLMDSFMIGDRKTGQRQANVLSVHAPDHVALSEIISAYPEGLDIRDAAWIFNRVLTALSLAHLAGYVHGAVVPENILVSRDPDDHHACLLDWCYSGMVGDKMKAKMRGAEYPKEVGKGYVLQENLDVYMASRVLLQLSKQIPPPIYRLLNACRMGPRHRIVDAAVLQQDFYDALKQLFGKPKFRRTVLDRVINKNQK